MNLDAFLHNLHADTDESGQPGREVDWEDAPLTYKLYRGLPSVPLSSEVPLTLKGTDWSAKPDLAGIGHFLWYVFGLAQVSHSSYAVSSLGESAGSTQTYRRFIPSGGGLYPNEIYVYLKINDAPSGVYHYDAAHHRLVLLREGDYDSYAARALGHRCDVSACFGVVFVSTMFWKNAFKYGDFAYRLQGLDAGVLLGQLLEVAKRFGFAAGVHFQFLDRAVDRLLGLSEREESVYAVIPLSTEGAAAWSVDGKAAEVNVSAAELCRELPEIRLEHYERSRRVKEFPMLIKMNEASMLESADSFRRAGAAKNVDSGLQTTYLSRAKQWSYDLASICRKRFSPETEFVMGDVSEAELAALLHEASASFSYRNDLDAPEEKPLSRVSLYGCLYNVHGVPDGAYRYESAAHALRRIFPGDHRLRLQQGMYLHNVNLCQVPLCLHVAGDKDYLKPAMGYRGYRIQQMEAGMLVQRLLLAASAIGMGGRPLLGFSASHCDEIYKLGLQGKTSLIQIPVGTYRGRPRLQGGLHS